MANSSSTAATARLAASAGQSAPWPDSAPRTVSTGTTSGLTASHFAAAAGSRLCIDPSIHALWASSTRRIDCAGCVIRCSAQSACASSSEIGDSPLVSGAIAA